MNANVTLTGAVDDARGLGVAVHQDHAGVRIDAGGIEITFDLSSLQAFMHLLADAAVESRLWEIGQAAHLETMADALSGITEAGHADPVYDRDAEMGYVYTDPQASGTGDE